MSQPWNPIDYARNAAFVPALGAPVVALLAPRAGERILDVGCGDGVLTNALVDAGAEVVGVDASETMVAAARARGLDARLVDAHDLPFTADFDAAFSNAALHWMLRPADVAAGVFRALRAGGRFVGEMGGEGNIATIRAGIRRVLSRRGYTLPASDPQWYASPDEFRAVYEAAGFVDVDARLIERPTPLPTGIKGWVRTFRSGFLDHAGVPATDEAAVLDEIEAELAPALCDDAGHWTADYVRLRFTARKPE